MTIRCRSKVDRDHRDVGDIVDESGCRRSSSVDLSFGNFRIMAGVRTARVGADWLAVAEMRTDAVLSHAPRMPTVVCLAFTTQQPQVGTYGDDESLGGEPRMTDSASDDSAAITALAAAAAERIPSDLPDDHYSRANMVSGAVLGHHDAHMTWPLWQHAEGHMSRRSARLSIVEGIRRSRTAIIALGLGDLDVASGVAASELIADAMIDA